MYIHQLDLSQFRNYEQGKITFGQGLNIIFGDNAQGKTNILEAIYLCATSKSHRTAHYKEMIHFDCEEAHVHLKLIRNNQSEEIDLHLKNSNKKGIAINKVPIKRMNELLGVVHVIMFSPEDLGLIKNGPKDRRRFINVELSQLEPLYYYHLTQYHKVLKQRNNLLRLIQMDSKKSDQLEVWDLQLLEYGKKVIEYRTQFVDELNPIFMDMHLKLSGEKEKILLIYEQSCTLENFEKVLKKNKDRDIRMGSTTMGPHHDDLLFDLNGVDLRKFGSQGQQRTVALSLKLSEIELVKMKIEDTPVLLLDDVLSELDNHRQIALMSQFENLQTIITCTGIDDFIKQRIINKKMFYIKDGQILIKDDV